ncbi:MAG: hypothetical protein PHE28_03320 [Bacteroidales bacterium]|jgi:hypothetical protein|nr:hypothetical protein [Bacteroidales bacterium]
MKKVLLVIMATIIFVSCQTQKRSIDYSIKNTYEEYYTLKTYKSFDEVWDLLIKEIVVENEDYPKVLEKTSGLLVMDYYIGNRHITRERKDDNKKLVDSLAYFVSPFTSTIDKEITEEELDSLERKKDEYSYYDSNEDYNNINKLLVEEKDVLLYIKLTDLGKEREIMIKFGNKGALKSTGNYEEKFLNIFESKLNQK